MEYTREFFLTSSLEKVFPSKRPSEFPKGGKLFTWPGAKASVQLVYSIWGCNPPAMVQELFSVKIESEPFTADIYKVGLISVEMPCQPGADGFFISKEAGLYPDPLIPLKEDTIGYISEQYRSLWISWKIPEDAKPGEYTAHIRIKTSAGKFRMSGIIDPPDDYQIIDIPVVLSIGSCKLPYQRIIHKELFHADCLCDYYGVSAWSERHWEICENFLMAAEEHMINEVTLPVFTLCFDTAPYCERTTAQLVKVYVDKGEYSFDFDNVDRWLDLCKKYNVKVIGVPPFFTQWGAVATPPIMAEVDGEYQKWFGWHVPATSSEYRKFLEAFIPELKRHITDKGYDKDHITFRISDEPQPEHLEGFMNARKQLLDLVEDCTVIDSASSLEYYEKGIVPFPEVCMDMVHVFREAKVPRYYTYYCCAQIRDVPNRFMAMPSCRNRVNGVCLYMENVAGFGHWGFNFYNTIYSKYHIDPFHPDHAEDSFPAGDAYLVYPGDDGTAWSSIRSEVQDDAFYDYRSLQLLEELRGREYVENIILEEAGMKELTFLSYPRTPAFLENLRKRIASEIEAAIK